MTDLSNEYLNVRISQQGAELQSIIRKDNQMEYLWSGDPAFWGKKSPVLFPIVGGLKNNTYTYNNKSYQLGRHGFAREMVFEVSEKTYNSVYFTLSETPDTLSKYPFYFNLGIRYTINEAALHVTYSVQNTGDEDMYFSIGAHPAFKVPSADELSFEDYALHFNQPETDGIWPLTDSGLIKDEPVPYLENTTVIPLQKSLFYKDALVFKNLASDTISLRSEKSPHGADVHYPDFPYMGIWSAKDANFVCIEPWCGIADHESSSGKLEEKEGIIKLAPEAIFTREWSAVFF